MDGLSLLLATTRFAAIGCWRLLATAGQPEGNGQQLPGTVSRAPCMISMMTSLHAVSNERSIGVSIGVLIEQQNDVRMCRSRTVQETKQYHTAMQAVWGHKKCHKGQRRRQDKVWNPALFCAHHVRRRFNCFVPRKYLGASTSPG